MSDIAHLLDSMICYFKGDAKRINHFLKVYGFAKSIGIKEGLTETEQRILEIAAITHDIGIKNSETKYNSSAGHYQEIEGPPEAKKMLESLGFNASVIDRVCWLISRHHSYLDIMARDHQILIESDFLVNAYEENLSDTAIHSIRDKVFQTQTGKEYLDILYIKK